MDYSSLRHARRIQAVAQIAADRCDDKQYPVVVAISGTTPDTFVPLFIAGDGQKDSTDIAWLDLSCVSGAYPQSRIPAPEHGQEMAWAVGRMSAFRDDLFIVAAELDDEGLSVHVIDAWSLSGGDALPIERKTGFVGADFADARWANIVRNANTEKYLPRQLSPEFSWDNGICAPGWAYAHRRKIVDCTDKIRDFGAKF